MAFVGNVVSGPKVAPAQQRHLLAFAERATKVQSRTPGAQARNFVQPPSLRHSNSQLVSSGQSPPAAAAIDGVKPPAKEGWWTRESVENMVEISSLAQLVDELGKAQDKLVIVDFYAQWCNACRSLYPKLCKLARENPEVVLLKVNWKENRSLCKMLGIKVLPYFHFYRGAEGRVEAFSASISKFARLKDAIALHSTPRCSLGPAMNMQDFVDSAMAENKSQVGVSKEGKDPGQGAASMLTAAAKF